MGVLDKNKIGVARKKIIFDFFPIKFFLSFTSGF